MRLRLTCQFDGQYRIVEVTGVASVDNAVDHCDETTFGYPGAKDSNRQYQRTTDRSGG